MSTRTLLLDSADRIFADHCDKTLLDAAERGEFAEALFNLVHENGFQQLAMKSSGVELADALAVLTTVGRHAVPLPLAEMLLANRWLDDDAGLTSVGLGDASGAQAVPWGRRADRVIAIGADGTWLLEDLSVEEAVNLAGEPRDKVTGAKSQPLELEEDGYLLLALSRVALMAGGLSRALDLSLAYVNEREQFGRPIAKFQAVQHHLAVMAAETAAALRAADAALAGIDGDRAEEEVAVGKSRVGEAVRTVAELAQQVHGAMGYTHEHRLHHTTRRLWAWRDEFGTEPVWERRLGEKLAALVAAEGGTGLWSFIATRA